MAWVFLPAWSACIVLVRCRYRRSPTNRREQAPAESLASIKVTPGFRIELVASEPLVKDPIAFDWGADGKLWVVEMGDYPLGIDGKGKPGGVVRFLEDTEWRRPIRQADDLSGRTRISRPASCPGGRECWSPALRRSSMPRIATATARPTIARCSLPASAKGNQQHRLERLRAGPRRLDLRRQRRQRRQRPLGEDRKSDVDQRARFPVPARYRRLRGRERPDPVRPAPRRLGRLVRQQQPELGLALRPRRITTSAAIRSFAPPDPRQTLEPDTRLYPDQPHARRDSTTSRAANHVTSANSPTPYRDDLFGSEFATSLFVSEPVHNLVHRMVLEPDGVSFRGRRGPGEANREFLASSDNWFRPDDAQDRSRRMPSGSPTCIAPSSSIPSGFPTIGRSKLDLRAGSEQGRIYRVIPVDKKPRPIPRLDRLDTPGLVAALDSRSGWQRDTAQRLLLASA